MHAEFVAFCDHASQNIRSAQAHSSAESQSLAHEIQGSKCLDHSHRVHAPDALAIARRSQAIAVLPESVRSHRDVEGDAHVSLLEHVEEVRHATLEANPEIDVAAQ